MDNLIKICGLSTPETLDVALGAGADMVGFVRFPKSPRHVSLDLGHKLSLQARGRAQRVVLLVNPGDEDVAQAIEALNPDLIQLHGSESPERVAEIRTMVKRPVMKALGIAEASDLQALQPYAGGVDRILLDAKPPRRAGALPGGNGIAFDWRLLNGLDRKVSFMLSGGLDPDNVAEAIRLTKPQAVDVSSGVESGPGLKDPARIEAFIRAARTAFAAAHH
ncbi:phosphoribosylanthranilate isomerase [Microvirga lotononidis]|uniref:N-(5'-phosphoribosyl)anthranilate isomerase n=1 Tax=Microvirga lotononidis TaxID=864069 RepID=I4YYM1_9HYPH|nr:phosphoribosylanthranilate isomerase [Microvirga lotononidis]EIM29063.1 phosphoribosylanthranilate isomerase [Microvirga lotononidis]WQO28907.1 phosphoribosylanthranilate isomerase [Microvirga lotononidis]